jgi:aspartyl protease family protein
MSMTESARRPRKAVVALALAVCAFTASAQKVSLGGSFGDKALLVIDGVPRSVAVGATVQGVRLVSVAGVEAVVEVKGQRSVLTIGGTQVNLGGAESATNGTRIVLTAESGGHFVTSGAINGKAVRFLVDTGATNVGMSQAEAERLGIDFRKGEPAYSMTANGAIPVVRVSLGSVRVGEVTVYNVEATVLPLPMSHVLLGNSFLTRFQMKRENDTLTLDRRY